MKILKNGLIKADEVGNTGNEPTWTDAADLTLDELKIRAMNALRFYTYNASSKDMNPFVVEWMKAQKKYTKDDIALIKKYGEKTVPTTAAKVCRMLNLGMPIKVKNDKNFKRMYYDYVVEKIKDGIAKARFYKPTEDDTAVVVKPQAPKASPMKLLEDKTVDTIIGPLEDMLDEWTTSKGAIKTPDLYGMMIANSLPAAACRFVKAYLNPILKELKEAQAGKCDQLNEAYAYLGKRQLNGLVRAFTKMTEDIKKYELDKKPVRKQRVKKPRAATKQVEKLQYLSTSPEYVYTSTDPVNIPGAQLVVLFNTKYRRLTLLKAVNRDGLSIKGTTICDFDVDTSKAVTLRKPQDMINMFKKGTTLTKIENALAAVKTKAKEAKGRVNSDTLILYAKA